MTDTDLVLLTTEFPFGSVAETFLETELPIVAERVRNVYLLPSHRREGVRPIPRNVEVVEMPWLSGYTSGERRRALMSAATGRVALASARTSRDALNHLRSPKQYADLLARNLLKARDLRAFVRHRGLGAAIFYDYWFENSTLALSLLRTSGTISTAVARAHGFDIFDEAWHGLSVPFRQAKAQGLDNVFPTSVAGADYLRAKVPALRDKLRVHRLGVLDPGVGSPDRAADDLPLVVTCARLVPLKRLHLVPEVLARLDTPARWVHIGDGEERDHVEAAARRHLAPDLWQLVGRLDNQEVLEFYARNSVQALLSVSSSEGLPVSMMEAQSYGIPVVACDVGGISELVTPKTGALVSADASPEAIGRAVELTLRDPDLTRDTIRAEFRGRYDAVANYGAFADDILSIHSRQDSSARLDD